MKGRLWKKLFTQAIPFFAMLYMVFALFWISADYVLAFLGKSPVGETTVTLANGIPVALIAIVISSGFDHWLQDRYQTDNEGRPLDWSKDQRQEQRNETAPRL